MNSLFRLFESLLNKHGRYKVFGKTIKYNNLVNGTATLSLETAHKYFTKVSGVASIQTGISSLSVNSGDIVCDLTLLQDTSTTLEQFYATDLGKEIQKGFYPPYSPTNAIYEAELSEMNLSGRNLWDEQWESGSINLETGQPYATSYYFRSKNFCDIKPNTTYRRIGNNNIRLFFYDKDKNFISYLYGSINTNFTTPANAYYFKLSPSALLSVYNYDIVIQLSTETDTTYTPYVKPQKVSILQNGQPLKLGGIGTAKDYYLNASGKVGRATLFIEDLSSLNWTIIQSAYGYYDAEIVGIKQTTAGSQVFENVCSKYKAVSANAFNYIKDTMYLNINSNSLRVATGQGEGEPTGSLLTLLATPTTEQANSVMLRKGYTKCYDKNNLELEIEVIDPLNFSNKILQGKNAPTITVEKVITKGFISGGEHFTQLYIYEDGEIWYVNGSSSAQAYASGVWELEYKQLQFDNKVSLTENERNALLNIYDLL